MPQSRPAEPRMGSTTERVLPVFVDQTGRRRTVTVLAGVGLGIGLLVSLSLIVVGLFTDSAGPAPGWPDSGGQHQRDAAGVEPAVGSPTARPGNVQTTPAPGSTTQRSPIATRSAAGPSTAQSTPGGPGQSDEHRNSSPGKPSKSPGRPG